MYLKNIFLHFKLITYHRWLVFKLCCKAGEPWRGLTHDLSKYSPTEFFESVKYYTGRNSPITGAKKDKGYSVAWLHHKGRNKHHAEYWIDDNAPEKTPVIPYKYCVEMICDKIAAGKAYMKKEFTYQYELDYWMKEKEKIRINKKVEDFVTVVFNEIVEKDINNTLKKAHLKELYKKYCE